MITKTFFMAKIFRAHSANSLRQEKSLRAHGATTIRIVPPVPTETDGAENHALRADPSIADPADLNRQPSSEG
jgi:hypothetical protein